MKLFLIMFVISTGFANAFAAQKTPLPTLILECDGNGRTPKLHVTVSVDLKTKAVTEYYYLARLNIQVGSNREALDAAIHFQEGILQNLPKANASGLTVTASKNVQIQTEGKGALLVVESASIPDDIANSPFYGNFAYKGSVYPVLCQKPQD